MGKGDTAKGRAELELALRMKLAGDEADQAHRVLAQLH
jgi:hypothetical protein